MSVISIQTAAEVTGPNAPAPEAARPEGLPEKFKTVGDMVASYTELERRLGSAPVPPVVVPPVAPASAAITADPAKTVADAGLDIKALGTEFVQNGNKLTEASVTALAAKGITPETIANYVAGAKAAADGIVAEITTVAGSQANLEAALAWAKANLSADEIAAYNSVIDGGNKTATRLAFEGIHARYAAARGREPELVTAAAAASSGNVAGFASNAEIVAAMSDPKYREDSAYRSKVEARIGVTDYSKFTH